MIKLLFGKFEFFVSKFKYGFVVFASHVEMWFNLISSDEICIDRKYICFWYFLSRKPTYLE